MKKWYLVAFVYLISLSGNACENDSFIKDELDMCKKSALQQIDQQIEKQTKMLDDLKKEEDQGEKIPKSLFNHYKDSINSLTQIRKNIERGDAENVQGEMLNIDQTYNLFADHFNQ